MSSASASAPSSRRHSTSSSVSSPTAASMMPPSDPFAEALSLQEAASKPGLPRQEVARLLQQACDKYAAAELLGPPPPGALYNHAVALTDFSRIPPDAPSPSTPADVERTRKARLRAAAAKYSEAISEETRDSTAASNSSSSNSNSQSASSSGGGGRTAGPQALNNLGLVLQELSSFEPAGSRERAALAAAAAARFRAAARSRPDFERAVYNLGTVLYASAPPAAASNGGGSAAAGVPPMTQPQQPSSSSSSRDRQQQQPPPPPVSRAEALADAAQCVALAAALRPSAPVYARSLALVQPFLPLPGKLRAGWLLVPDPLPFGSFSVSSSSSSSSSSQQQSNQNQGGSFSFLPGSVTLVGGGGGGARGNKSSSSSSSLPLVFPSLRERFVARWCVIDAESLRAAPPPQDAPALPRGWERDENEVVASSESHQHGNGNSSAYYSSFSQQQHHHHSHHHSVSRPLRVALSCIFSATPAADASLPGPAGAGLHVRFVERQSSPSSPAPPPPPSSSFVAPPAGCFFVAPSPAAAEAWADALCVASHVARTTATGASRGGGGGPLARVLTPAVGTVASSGAGVVGRRPSSSGLGR